MRNRIVCCLPMETKVRDLDARLYLGLKCIEKGFSCLIGSKAGVHYTMFKLKRPFLYFDKGLDRHMSKFYEKIHTHGGFIVSLDEEGGVYYRKDFEKLFLARNHPDVLKYVDLFFVWAERQKEIILRYKKNINHSKVVVTGHPRFDLRKPAFGAFYKKLSNSTTSLPGEYILFNTNFGAANNQVPREEFVQYKVRYHSHYFDSDNFDLKYCYQKLVIYHFVETIKTIARMFPSLTIVLRPHPNENLQFYCNKLKGVQNVIITRDGSVQEWIVNALMVIHHDCTTAIEAFLFGKDVISYCPVYDESLTHDVPILISEVIKDEAFLIKKISQSFSTKKAEFNREKRKKKQEIIRKIIANIDFDASDVIINELVKFAETAKFNEDATNNTDTYSIKWLLGNIFYKLKSLGTSFSKKHHHFAARTKNKFPGLQRQEVEKRIELFREVNPSLPRTRLTQVKEHTFLIEKQ